MNVTELFRQLSYGPFRNLAIGADGAGTIEVSRQPQIIECINEALLRLHSRFLVRKNDVIIETLERMVYYHLSSRYAQSNPDPCPDDVLYIQDNEDDPFDDDVIKILAVYDTHGTAMPLNDLEHPDSVFTPQPTILQIPIPKDGEPIGIVYQARHKLLTYEDLDARIDIPYTLEGALKSYVAYEYFKNIGTQEATAKAQDHLNQYEMICVEVLGQDLVDTSYSQTNTRLGRRGFI